MRDFEIQTCLHVQKLFSTFSINFQTLGSFIENRTFCEHWMAAISTSLFWGFAIRFVLNHLIAIKTWENGQLQLIYYIKEKERYNYACIYIFW